MGKKRDALERQQEILADIAFNCGAVWSRVDRGACGKVFDAIEGSRGLMDHFVEWTKEFDRRWEAGEFDRDDYIGEVDAFAVKKLSELIREHV